MSININDESAGFIRDYTERTGASVTETIRRAMGAFAYLDGLRTAGESLYAEGADGKLRELVFLV